MGFETKIAGPVTAWTSALATAFVVAGLGYGEANAQTRTERFFDDWRVLCVETAEGAKQCTMSQTLVRSNPRQEVFRWTIIADRENQFINILSAPLGVSLKPGLELSMAGNEPMSAPYDVCGRRWCQASLPMSDEIWSQMATGEAVQVVYVNQRGQRLRTEATMRGFREAISYLQTQIGS